MAKPKKPGTWSKEAKERASQQWKERVKPPVVEPFRGPIIQEEFVMTNEESPEEVMSDKYISKRAFDYVDNVRFEVGEIVELRGMPNDKKLTSLGYVLPWSAKKEWESDCLKCGKSFGNTTSYNQHVASHYDVCSICGKTIPPENFARHQEAHQELAV